MLTSQGRIIHFDAANRGRHAQLVSSPHPPSVQSKLIEPVNISTKSCQPSIHASWSASFPARDRLPLRATQTPYDPGREAVADHARKEAREWRQIYKVSYQSLASWAYKSVTLQSLGWSCVHLCVRIEAARTGTERSADRYRPSPCSNSSSKTARNASWTMPARISPPSRCCGRFTISMKRARIRGSMVRIHALFRTLARMSHNERHCQA
jgi:hypothetical protein